MAMTIQYSNYNNYIEQPYAMTHNWDLVISEAAIPQELVGLAKPLLDGNGRINISCTGVNNLPNSNLEDKILAGNIRGVPFHQAAGRESSVREINIKTYDYWDYRLFVFFECWKSLAVNRYDFSQNMNAMLKSGVSIIWKGTDRQTPKLRYDLFDIVCTKTNLPDLAADPELVQTPISLKFGYYTISKGSELVISPNEASEYSLQHISEPTDTDTEGNG